MVLDAMAAVIVFVFLNSGRLGGSMAAVYRLGGTFGAVAAAKLLCKPTSTAILKAVAWSPQFSQGICFLAYVCIFAMIAHFVLAALIQEAEIHGGDGSWLDRTGGGLLGAARGALIVYVLLASAVLLTHRWGAKAEAMALPYHKSYVARFVMGWNVADPEVFPNAFLLRVIAGLEENTGPRPEALEHLHALAATQFLQTNDEVYSALKQRDWKSLRKNRDLFDLMCRYEFLRHADLYYTPVHTARAEDPEDRFNELKAK